MLVVASQHEGRRLGCGHGAWCKRPPCALRETCTFNYTSMPQTHTCGPQQAVLPSVRDALQRMRMRQQEKTTVVDDAMH